MAASMLARVSCGSVRCSRILPLINWKLSHPIQIYVRHHARWFKPFLLALNGQLKFIKHKFGEEPKKPRSHQDNWDYNSELYAFSKRLGEEFNDSTLRAALTHQSYVEKEEANRKEMGLLDKDAKLQLEHNCTLSNTGFLFSSDYIKSYLRHALPKVPEEGHRAIHHHLLSSSMLSHVAGNLGIRDLILCAEFPVPDEILETTFMAIIGALVEDQGSDRAGLFVHDFILPQLIDRDFCDIWDIANPMGLLSETLEGQGRELPESRLLREASKNTVMPLFMVGVYSDQKLLGWAPGESLVTAEEEAARVALRNLFGIPENRPPLPLDSIRHRKLHQTIVEELERGGKENQEDQIAAS